ncbi:general substrate transporter [Exophiala viscosa]|uniref:General substrate transporter n=1 Tax=Exophiala viscosa TaxID=2486360 RepID=A0AAN6DZM8_9EURO|nr:general substrate transporter [Exophiala viscosa]KAI1622639.1 general substrate transporter [Exophiala viscosa]
MAGVREVDSRAHYRPYTVFVILFMAMGSVTFGFSAANIGITLGQPSYIKYMGLATAKNASALIGGMNGAFYGGGFFGSCFHGWVANKYGRKWSIAIGCMFVLVSGGILTGSANVAMFIAFRFFNGWGCFQLLAGVPLWITEVVPPKARGMLADIHAVGLNTGYTVSAYAGVGFFYTHSASAWRPPIALQMVPPLIVLSGIYWIPESPRWLLTRGRDQEAWTIVRRLHVSLKDKDDSFAQAEFRQMKAQIEFESTLESGYLHIWKRPSYRKRAFMTVYLTFSMFTTGILVVNTYGATIYKSLGYDDAIGLQFQAGYVLCCLVFNIIAMTFVDRVPRNKLISFGFFCVMTCLIVETALQKYYIGTTDKAGLIGAVVVIFAFATSFSLFMDGPCYFYIAEIWPTHLRAYGYTLGIGALAVTNIIWLEAAPTAFANIGWRYYIFFIIFCAIACVTSFLVFPDTLHKPLEEIAAMFGDDDLVMLYQRDLVAAGSDSGTSEKHNENEPENVDLGAIPKPPTQIHATSKHVEEV